MTNHRLPGLVCATRALAIAASLAPFAAAQCSLVWQPGLEVSGVIGRIDAMCQWDPDGPGPATPRIVMAGSFGVAGNVLANRIASWDPATGQWGAFGSGVTGVGVGAVAQTPNGELYAAGEFAQAGGVPCSNIAVWSGGVWSPLSTGADDTVLSVVSLPNGSIVIGGRFVLAGGQTVNHVARWNGTSWSALGTGLVDIVNDLVALPNGDLVAATTSEVWRWNGSVWTRLGPTFSGTVDEVVALPNGDVVAGGAFPMIGSTLAANVARWDGTAWQPIDVGVNGPVSAMLVEPNGALVVAGLITQAGSTPVSGIARWPGTIWTALGAGVSLGTISGPPATLAALVDLPGGGFLVGGNFIVAGTASVSGLAKWDGAAWSGTGDGFDGYTLASVEMPNGDLVVGGYFTTIAGIPAPGIARRSGGVWSALGAPGALPLASKRPGLLANGDVALPGRFLSPSGIAPLIRWNGTAWTPVGSVFDGTAYTFVLLPNGDPVVGGAFYRPGQPAGSPPQDVALRWNGTNWVALTGFPSPAMGIAPVLALAVLPNGNLVAGKSPIFLGPPAVVAEWNGASWTPLGPTFGFSSIEALVVLPNGSLVAGGSFTSIGGTPVGGVAQWDGTSWTGLAGGVAGSAATVRSLRLLPDGSLLAGGKFTSAGGVPVASLARWDGTSWSPFGGGVDAFATSGTGGVFGMTVLSSGRVVVNGAFDSAGGVASPYFAELATTCPASAVSYGATCSTFVLTASRPWLGAPWTAGCAVLPANTLVARVLGTTSQSIALPTLLPWATPGCELLVFPDIVDFAVASGTYATQIDLPLIPALAGLSFHCQLLLTGAGLAGPSVTTIGTNGLRMTLGQF